MSAGLAAGEVLWAAAQMSGEFLAAPRISTDAREDFAEVGEGTGTQPLAGGKQTTECRRPPDPVVKPEE